MDKYSGIKKDGRDYINTGVKSIIGLIPVVGGLASEVFSEVITPSLERRREEWLDNLSTMLNELNEKVENFSIENLISNEKFVTCLIEASQLAIKNHQEEKLKCLKNAIVNTIIFDITDDKVKMFLNLVNELSCMQISILKFLDDPNAYYIRNGMERKSYYMGSPSALLLQAYPMLHDDKEYMNKLVKDLYSNGLINIESLNTSMTESGMYASRTTKFGKEFISFISKQDNII
ncbi:hypothetical protein [Clostridium butyricum]